MACVGLADIWLMRFRQVYRDLARRSMCDSVDSAEYRRVLAEWVAAGRPVPITPFVIVAANRPPGPFAATAD